MTGTYRVAILGLLLALLIAACIAFPSVMEGFDNTKLDVNCVEGCSSYTKCYAAYDGKEKSGILDMCSAYPGSSDETSCNTCKFCQWCPGDSKKSHDAKCISIYEKCPAGNPDKKSEWINTDDLSSSLLSVFDFTKYFGSHTQPFMDACGANISVWDNLQSGLQNLKYVNSSGNETDRPDRPDRPDRRRPKEDDENCEDDSWPEYASDQHRIADEQQERMAMMRSMKKAIRNELVDQLGKGIAMQQAYEEEEEEDCEDTTDCTQQGKEVQQQRVDMSKYIRKDSIPCWGCDVK